MRILMEQKTGWLSPDGDLYECDYYDHVSTAEDICNSIPYNTLTNHYDDELLKRGWAKLGLSLLGEKQFYIRWERPLSIYQRYALSDLLNQPKPKYPFDAITLTMWQYEDDYFEIKAAHNND